MYVNIKIVLPAENIDQEGETAKEDKEVVARVNPASIVAYHPGYYWGSFIYLSEGQILCTTLTCEEIDKLIEAQAS
jgi:hypothetical protein